MLYKVKKLKNLYLDVPLLILYLYVGKTDKYHTHIIKAVDPKFNFVAHYMLLMFIRIHISYIDNKLAI